MKKVLAMLMVGGFAASASAQDPTVLGKDFVILDVKESYFFADESDGKGKIFKEDSKATLVIKSDQVDDGLPMEALWVANGSSIPVVATFTPYGPEGKGVFSLEVARAVGDYERVDVALGKYKTKNNAASNISSKGAGVDNEASYATLKVRLNKKLSRIAADQAALAAELGISSDILSRVGLPSPAAM